MVKDGAGGCGEALVLAEILLVDLGLTGMKWKRQGAQKVKEIIGWCLRTKVLHVDTESLVALGMNSIRLQ